MLPFMEHIPTTRNTVAVTSSGLLNWNDESEEQDSLASQLATGLWNECFASFAQLDQKMPI